ncbi:MAG: DUF4367 domain-containing protein [Faecousia sp.]
MRDQRKDQLIQQYEEAALGLLLEEYADAEGKRLLQGYEASLKEGTIAPMPDELNAKCQKIIDQAYAKNHRRKLLSTITKAVGKAAMIALVLFGAVSAAILSVDAWRVPVLNFILDKSGDYAIVNSGSSNPALQKQFEGIVDTVCDYAPFDYALIQTPAVDEAALLIQMENSEEKLLTVTVRQSTDQIKADTEDAEYTELDLNGKPAYLIIEEGLFIMWLDEAQHLIYSVYAQDLPADAFWALVYALAE